MALSTFEDLTTWKPTITALHQAAQVVGRIQATLLPPRKNAQHLPLLPQPYGLTTQKLPDGSILDLNFGECTVYVYAHGREGVKFPLEDYTQVSLLKAIQAEISLTEVKKPEMVNHDSPLNQIDRSVSAQYAEVQYTAFTGIARFRARLGGMFSQVAVYPHHMDVSTLIFYPSNTDMDESRKHLNFGFAPFTEGQFERPYLYAYASPVTYPADFQPPRLPRVVVWNKEGWQGAVAHLADFGWQDDPEAYIEELCLSMYAVLMPLLE